ncbi:MAG TPA: thrombospondin type 3 repeat-containing protein, partial [Lamprocystis sp. (in: g-proteobacteria)]|nr:thrombospondin type 3 repeat-containing protein [Lamprocystis sp. (in: g-proteobacteria)]
DGLPAAQQAGDRVTLLIAPGAIPSLLSYRCFDVDSANELALTLDSKATGTCPVSGNNAWGTDQRVTLSAKARHLLVFDNTLNPPGTDPWGLRLLTWLGDTDADGSPDGSDNCLTTANPDQANLDADALGDACDPDGDNDGVLNTKDAFPRDPTEWLDSDHDRIGNTADVDDDNDGYPDAVDPAPLDARQVPPALIGVYHPAALSFQLDTDASRSETADDARPGPFGQTGDRPLRGDWNGDGRDEIGVYRPSEGRFYLDVDGDGAWTPADGRSDVVGSASDLPVSGDWDGDGQDEIGLYHLTTRFTLDLDGSLSPTGNDVTTAAFGLAGDLPVIGDWNGDGQDELGVWRPGSAPRFYLDKNANWAWNKTGDRTTGVFGKSGDRPLVGDWNGDGQDEIGVYRPAERRFYLDLNGSWTQNTGDAVSAPFGTDGDLPLSGRW